MNLYDFSQINNNEMGIYISRDIDPDLYKDVHDEAMRLIRISDEIKISVEKVPYKENNNDISKADAFCIRCKKEIALNQSQPYCGECFKGWKRYSNKNYKEKYCHLCGKENESTINKPICYDCFKSKNNKNDVEVKIQTDKGFCIRCKKDIAKDTSQPYCPDCFKVWSKYKNINYQEKHCHSCGKQHTATSSKPICYTCYKISNK